MFIQTETTPNPEVLKFLPGREVLGEGAREFKTAEEGDASPLADERVARSGLAALAGLLTVVASLLLERACRVRSDDRDN